ncbi:hypothetical protein CRV03_07275 [Arcobacter sp. F155]|uniref:hypothetical protein n=1 Tax=Arcobacter sp. F155 TaxID=2044512 RepID=UPI00100BDEBD|nr:hypothetical protein [Arcobacter sp. F155]RXJ77056.1 hypothetical protein CRV03_07275 [Arcobacter sp. F155]
MQILNLLENSFEKAATRVKLELFLFPLIIIASLIYFLEQTKVKESKRSLFSSNIFIQKKSMDKSLIEVIKDIETYLEKNSIQLIDISNIDEKIQLQVNASTLLNLKLLDYIEHYNNFSSIKTLRLTDDSLLLTISFDKSFIKTSNKESKLELAYLEKHISASKKYTLKAIVGNEVLINEKWLSLGEKVNKDFKVEKINRNSAVIKSETIQIELRLYNETI